MSYEYCNWYNCRVEDIIGDVPCELRCEDGCEDFEIRSETEPPEGVWYDNHDTPHKIRDSKNIPTENDPEYYKVKQLPLPPKNKEAI